MEKMNDMMKMKNCINITKSLWRNSRTLAANGPCRAQLEFVRDFRLVPFELSLRVV